VVSTTSIDIADAATGPASPTPLVQTKFNRNGVARLTGAGWHLSDSSGRLEIYVRPFRRGLRQWQVRPAGGRQPLWARNGKELFYVASEGALMSVPVATSATWNAGAPTKLIEADPTLWRGLVSATGMMALDGRRFLMMKAARNDPAASPQPSSSSSTSTKSSSGRAEPINIAEFRFQIAD
jgi:hypothetical protein